LVKGEGKEGNWESIPATFGKGGRGPLLLKWGFSGLLHTSRGKGGKSALKGTGERPTSRSIQEPKEEIEARRKGRNQIVGGKFRKRRAYVGAV